MAVSLICPSKKDIGSHQLHRMLGVTYETARLMAHRIRYAMQQPQPKVKLIGVIECDECDIGGCPRMSAKEKHIDHRTKRGRGTKKVPVVALVQRNAIVKSQVINRVTAKNLKEFMKKNASKKKRGYDGRLQEL